MTRRVTYRQEGGDDGYCYVVRVDGQERWNGLTRREAVYYRDVEEQTLRDAGQPLTRKK